MTSKTVKELAAEFEEAMAKVNADLAKIPAELGELRAKVLAMSGERPPSPAKTFEQILAELSMPFPPEQIGKLPRSGCKQCKQAGSGQGNYGKTCNKHDWVWSCNLCGQHHPNSHIHLDYVGHSEITARLNAVDPMWTWRPMGRTPEGLPAMTKRDKTAELWIELTVGGHTRPGVGTAATDKDEVCKELIGDALRNAGMRFGMALDLWSKSESLEQDLGDAYVAPSNESAVEPPQAVSAPNTPESTPQARGDAGRTANSTPNGSDPAEESQEVEPVGLSEAFARLSNKATVAAKQALEAEGLWPIKDVGAERANDALVVIEEIAALHQ